MSGIARRPRVASDRDLNLDNGTKEVGTNDPWKRLPCAHNTTSLQLIYLNEGFVELPIPGESDDDARKRPTDRERTRSSLFLINQRSCHTRTRNMVMCVLQQSYSNCQMNLNEM